VLLSRPHQEFEARFGSVAAKAYPFPSMNHLSHWIPNFNPNVSPAHHAKANAITASSHRQERSPTLGNPCNRKLQTPGLPSQAFSCFNFPCLSVFTQLWRNSSPRKCAPSPSRSLDDSWAGDPTERANQQPCSSRAMDGVLANSGALNGARRKAKSRQAFGAVILLNRFFLLAL